MLWIKYWDNNVKAYYFYNWETKEAVWEEPEEYYDV